jgi:hypothetical protein
MADAQALHLYPLAGPPGRLRLWLGAYGPARPPALQWSLDGRLVEPRALRALAPIPEGTLAATAGAAYAGVFELAVTPGPHEVAVRAGGGLADQLRTAALPAAIGQTLGGGFRVLLASCYSRDSDRAGLVGRICAQLPRPDLTLLLGDQIYGDLPLREDLPEAPGPLAAALARKYRANWTRPGQHVEGGLRQLLRLAPYACVADDHEYWNNFPQRQAQLPNTWTVAGRERWARAARALYDCYQAAPDARAGTQRIDVEPLSLLLVDLRSDRREDFSRLASDETLHEIVTWVDSLIDGRNRGELRYAVLCSGQPLLSGRPPGTLRRAWIDAEMSSFDDWPRLLSELQRLTDHGIPLMYLTGDVHWSRVTQARDARSGRLALLEVISSPARLIASPMDRVAAVRNEAQALFGDAQRWYRHPAPAEPPTHFGTAARYTIGRGAVLHRRRGDQVATLDFSRAGSGLRLRIRCHGIAEDPAGAAASGIPAMRLLAW